MVLAYPPYTSRSARGQNSFAYDVFLKKDIGDSVSFVSDVVASEAYGHFFSSDLIFFCLV